jgi:mRNA-degrading endonuclease toxin of MazEF toxin-antitoxin module
LIGRTAAFTYLGRVLVAEVTTSIRGIPQEVSLGAREGLARRSVANLDSLRTVPRAHLVQRVGTLHPDRHIDVKCALGHVLSWPELTSL